MKISVLRMILMGGLTFGSVFGATSAFADPAITNHRPDPVHLGYTQVPEIPANGLAAGVLLVLGGAAVILGRRRQRS